ncbi:hypothetical protein [Methylobacterium planeticum]|uniref:Uncharacterized protein n=1 Tax=Methylobacterium planeticum TaxID=2615211 RepID=A0A6N6MG96_9HYPH|nr:hypothetical protein [Methylobacterium planeticum]KAB1068872.1 hypothetical protein F6X51_26070 [Methylobacterium planeticum]
MSEVTFYVFQPFKKATKGNRIIAGEAVQVPNRRSAERAVEALRGGLVGALAFSRTGDPTEGEWGDAKLIAQNGLIPEEFLSASVPW